MAQAQRLLLAGIEKLAGADFGCLDSFKHVELAAGFQNFIEIAVDVEMVFDRGFALTGHEDDIFDAGRACSSTACWISGLSSQGSISLGIALVAGRNRVPSPATGKTAFHCFTHEYLFSLRVDDGITEAKWQCLRPESSATRTRCSATTHYERISRSFA